MQKNQKSPILEKMLERIWFLITPEKKLQIENRYL